MAGGCCFQAFSLLFLSFVISSVFKGQTVDEIRTGWVFLVLLFLLLSWPENQQHSTI